MRTRHQNLEAPSGRWSRWSAAYRRYAWLSQTPSYLRVKRLIDFAVAALAILVLSPLALVIALAIRLESRGNPLFHQTRVGKDGRLFRCWKFRSMYIDAEERRAALLADAEKVSGGVRFKMKSDPRITRVGKILRKLSLDELPQLWNVFVGDMSLVGPRPPIPEEVRRYTLDDRRRLSVTPGITCVWQVSGRSDIPFDQQVEMDTAYAEEQSLTLDAELLVKTVPAVILGKGAY